MLIRYQNEVPEQVGEGNITSMAHLKTNPRKAALAVVFWFDLSSDLNRYDLISESTT